jgi:hypothetical protein
MRPHVVLVLPPDPNDASGMVMGVTVVEVQKLVTEFPVEGFDITFSPALPRWDQHRFGFACMSATASLTSSRRLSIRKGPGRPRSSAMESDC